MCVISFYFTHTVMLVFCHAGGELCAWDDAAQTDAGDVLISLTPYMIGGSLSCFWGEICCSIIPTHSYIYISLFPKPGILVLCFVLRIRPIVFGCRCR